MAKIIVHADLNAFYASAEVIKNPSLKGKPLLIGHEGRSGIVSTASYEARKKGCASGMPMFQAKRLCPEAIVIPPDFDFYQVLSNSFFCYLANYTRIIEKASIDEAYLDMTDALSKTNDPVGLLKSMQQGLLKELGLSISIGVGPTKWLAKMGSDLKKPLGLTIIRKRDIKKIIFPLPIEKFWGIGNKTAPRLRQLGIKTIGDLYEKIDEDAVNKELGKFASTCKQWLKGEGDDIVNDTPSDPKSISVSTTLMSDKTGFAAVKDTLLALSKEVALRAKKAKKAAYVIVLSVKDTEFRLHSKRVSLQFPTDRAEIIYQNIENLYRANFEEKEVRLVGVGLEKLTNPAHDTLQMSLWDYEEYEEKDATRLLVEKLNAKLSSPMLSIASTAKLKEDK